MVCRNAARGKEAVEAVRAETGNADVHLKAGQDRRQGWPRVQGLHASMLETAFC